MLRKEENELLTRVGPGTPMGEVFRRFWLPAVLSEEVSVAGGTPVRLRILCEDLLALRDSSGKLGIIDAYCSHRQAPLFFGRNENCAIQCPYHGWRFDVNGECIETPNAPNYLRDTPNAKARLAITAYPTHEAGGIVWIYMGPRDEQPPFPRFEFTLVPEGYNRSSRWLQRSNWLQGMEGEIDTSHISFAHKDLSTEHQAVSITGLQYSLQDDSPVLSVKETDYGFMSGSRRNFDGKYFWRMTQWLTPMFSLIPRAPSEDFTSGGGRAWVPVDDNNTITFAYNFRVDRPLSAEEHKLIDDGAHFPPRITRGIVQLEEGQRIDTYLPVANRDNDYLVDREMQKTVNFTGIFGVNEQDRCLQEAMRAASGHDRGIVDRTREHLVAADLAITAARRRLLRMVKTLQEGKRLNEVTSGELYAVRAVSRICGIADFDEFTESYRAAARANP
jgi:nitrite reductase/ring-hydroxylating ferredoxin subunit